MAFIGNIDQPPSDDPLAPDLEQRIDALLRIRLSRLKLPEDIKQLFIRRIRGNVRRATAAWCYLVGFLVLANAGFDVFLVPHALLMLVFAFRLIPSIGFLSAGQLFARDIAIFLAPLYIGLPCLLCIIFAGCTGLAAHSPTLLCLYLDDALIVCATCIMFVGLTMHFQLALVAIALPLIALVIAASGIQPAAAKLQVMFFDTSLLTALIYGRHIQNLVLTRMFLLNMRDELREAHARARHEKLSSIAYTDKLTDIPNRRYFDEICASMSETTKHLLPLALCMIDIDHFKRLNDKLGHLQGDRCLKLVAAAIRNNLRGQSDILARYGGEEFVLLLPGTDLAAAYDIAERVRAAIVALDHPNPGAPQSVVTVSIGVAELLTPPIALQTLLQSADQALYRAKLSGRNRVST